VFFVLEIPILGGAWWIYFTALKGHRSEWRSKVSLAGLILVTFCVALLLLAVVMTPERAVSYDYLGHWRRPAVLLSLVTLVASCLGARGLKALLAGASVLSILSWIFAAP
jgi:uncharacterized integral membrane protein